MPFALVGVAAGWTVFRRMQQGEYADWLLRDTHEPTTPATGRIALEVSGVAGSDPYGSRVREKVDRCARIGRKAVCVVEFGPPESTLVYVGP